MDFRNARIFEAHFQDVIFQKDVDFSDAEFGIPIYKHEKSEKFIGPPKPETNLIFRFVTFESDAYFIRTKFFYNTAFERTNFKGEANFKEAVFKEKDTLPCKREVNSKEKERFPYFSFSYLNFKHLYLKWDQLPDIQCWVREPEQRIKSFADKEEEEDVLKSKTKESVEPLSEVLSNLEASFRSQNQLDDANKAHYHMESAKLDEQKTPCQVIKWLFWGIPCEYGTSLGWISFWCILSFAIFFVIILFSKENHLEQIQGENAELKENWILNLFRLYKTEPPDPLPIYETKQKALIAFNFSIVVLFKVKFDSIHTVLSGKKARIIVLIGWGGGFYLLFCLGYTLRNTFPLLNRLFEGVF